VVERGVGKDELKAESREAVAAAILPIATAYVISESLGFEKGIGNRIREAPVFMGVIVAMIVISTVVAVIR
jgi:hypothetical protein